ncbi:MAG: ankyrin repeat domain-containing protein [Gammaproteobacteria bacterium]|nr:ankyrin repeat domain-containing protein [Gammaproteobacteria bacterium]MBU1482015.1 ankyrin repeat domain-containing protein [Gammaproteobacteria bacterium]
MSSASPNQIVMPRVLATLSTHALASLVFWVSCSSWAVQPQVATNAPQGHTQTPSHRSLCEVARAGDRPAVAEALRSKNDVNRLDPWGRTALFCAVESRKPKVVQDILDHGADPNHVADNGDTPILHAVEMNSLPIVETLARGGANINYAGENGMTPLMIAVAHSERPLFEALMEMGADPNKSHSGRDTPLLISIKKKDRYFIDRLLEAGANATNAGYRGTTPLMSALRTGQIKIAKKLLAIGGRANEVDDESCNAMTYAVNLPGVDVAFLRQLEIAGAKPDQQTRNGLTPLMIAAYKGEPSIVRYLLERGVNVNATTSDGYTALMLAIASRSNSISTIDLLVKNGSNVELIAKNGTTALKLACIAQDSNLIGYLYEQGAKADFDISSPEGLELSSILKQAMGDYFFSQSQYSQARTEYELAGSHYAELARLSDKNASLTSFLQHLNSASEGLLRLFPQPEQNPVRGREIQQALALRQANNTGTGTSGYYSYLKNHKNSNASFTSFGYNTEPPKQTTHTTTGVDRYRHEAEERALAYRRKARLMTSFVQCLDQSLKGRTHQDCMVEAMESQAVKDKNKGAGSSK